MKALKTTSVQILIVGIVFCSAMYMLTDELTMPTIFASAFTAIVTGRKVRDVVQSNKELYYKDNELKKAE